ncbi:MAG TPA: alginate lyase family protein [Armatimonadota bacterium]|nr:alginate lyase family protein [Armatimonadota bacterium]
MSRSLCWIGILCLGTGLAAAGGARAADGFRLQCPYPGPHLLLSARDLEYQRWLVTRHAFKQDALRAMRRRLVRVTERPPTVPPLEAVKRPPNLYTTGPGRDGGVREFFFEKGTLAADDARDCALVFQFTRELPYLHKASEILMAYVGTLNPLPQDYANNMAAVHYVSMPVLKFAWTYDLIAEHLSASDRAAVEDWLLQAALFITEHDDPAASLSTLLWADACVLAIGYVTDRGELVDWALNRPERGLTAQMVTSIAPHGEITAERGRHTVDRRSLDLGIFDLEAMAAAAEMALHNGTDLWDPGQPGGAQLRRCSAFYAGYASRHIGRPVPEGDAYAGEKVSPHKAPLFELLYLRFRDEALARVLIRHRGGYDGHLLGDAALAFGVPLG